MGKKKEREQLSSRDLWSRLLARTGTKESLVPVLASNRDQRPLLLNCSRSFFFPIHANRLRTGGATQSETTPAGCPTPALPHAAPRRRRRRPRRPRRPRHALDAPSTPAPSTPAPPRPRRLRRAARTPAARAAPSTPVPPARTASSPHTSPAPPRRRLAAPPAPPLAPPPRTPPAPPPLAVS